jgi:putative ABC transport system permease protein
VTALISGSYPSFYVSSFQPVRALRGSYGLGSKSNLIFRNSLVVIQFVLTIIMLISTVTVFRQMHFIRNKELGFDNEHIINIPLVRDFSNKFNEFRNEFTHHSLFSDATISNTPITVRDYSNATWEGKADDTTRMIYKASVDYNFIDFYNIEIIEGRKFSQNISTDNTAYILNETAVKDFNLENPIGKRFSMYSRPGIIIGVMKDFHFLSLHLEIKPLTLKIEPAFTLSLKIHPQEFDLQDTIAYIEKTYKHFFPGHPFEYTFLDENIEQMYVEERKRGQIFNGFTFLAILIACLGLYGLVLNMTEQRTKEIGIRKVLGSRVSGIVLLLTKKFLTLVLTANLIAWPLAYYAMQRWLQSFAYQVNIGAGIFIFSGLTALTVALLTISVQSIKAATTNPVESLRYE